MGKGYLIDTNVLIDAQMNRLPEAGLRFLADIVDKDFIVSFVTYIEYLGHKDVSKTAEQFVKLAEIILIDEDIIERCIEVRKSCAIKLPDAIIASTALSRKLTLITRNTADFKGMTELKVINPWEVG